MGISLGRFVVLMLAPSSFASAAPPGATGTADGWRSDVSKAVLEGRCDDARMIALRAGDLDVAEQALRLCIRTPPENKSPSAPPKSTIGLGVNFPPQADTRGNPGDTTTQSQNQPIPARYITPKADLPAQSSYQGAGDLGAPVNPSCDVHIWLSRKLNNFDVTTAALLGAPLESLMGNEKEERTKDLFFEQIDGRFFRSNLDNRRALFNGENIGINVEFYRDDFSKFTDPSNSNRNSNSSNTCYIEYYVDNIEFVQSPIYGTTIVYRISSRDFRGPTMITSRISNSKKLKERYPPKSIDFADQSISAMKDAVNSGIIFNIAEKMRFSQSNRWIPK